MKKLLILVLVPVFLASCQTNSNSSLSNEQVGTGIGALAGGFFGNKLSSKKDKTRGTVIGALIGGIIGNSIGRQLDSAERMAASRTEYYALENGKSGSKYNWDNPGSGNNGYVVPGPSYDRGGEVCRPYTHTVYIDGKSRIMKGRACKNEDGSWSAI